MAVVRKVTLRNTLSGMLGLLPATIITAMASPMARPMPSTMPATMPLLAAGMLTLKIVSIFVAPSARLASSYSGVFWAYLSCEAAGRYFARKEKSVLATAVLAGLASLFSLVSYILETLP